MVSPSRLAGPAAQAQVHLGNSQMPMQQLAWFRVHDIRGAAYRWRWELRHAFGASCNAGPAANASRVRQRQAVGGSSALTIIAPNKQSWVVMKVLLVDAFPMVRAALTGLIERHFAGAQVQGVDSADAARAVLALDVPRLVLLDLRVEGGFELMQQIHRDHLVLPVVVISGSDDTEDALQALGAGAMGYVPERSDLDTLVQALHLVLAGGTYVPALKPRAESKPQPASIAAASPVPDWAELPLTPRQKHVLHLLTQGLSNKLIARELGVSLDTVKDHVAAVLKALGVSSRTQAVVVAQKTQRGA